MPPPPTAARLQARRGQRVERLLALAARTLLHRPVLPAGASAVAGGHRSAAGDPAGAGAPAAAGTGACLRVCGQARGCRHCSCIDVRCCIACQCCCKGASTHRLPLLPHSLPPSLSPPLLLAPQYADTRPLFDMLLAAYPRFLRPEWFDYDCYLWAAELWYSYAFEVGSACFYACACRRSCGLQCVHYCVQKAARGPFVFRLSSRRRRVTCPPGARRQGQAVAQEAAPGTSRQLSGRLAGSAATAAAAASPSWCPLPATSTTRPGRTACAMGGSPLAPRLWITLPSGPAARGSRSTSHMGRSPT